MTPDPFAFIQNHIFLIVVAFISGAMLLWPLVRRSAGGPSVSTLEATHLINREDAVIIDVREPADYASGHVLGAKNVPLSQLESRIGDLEKHKAKPVIVCCEAGNRAGAAQAALRAKGFERAVNLSGGVAAWRQAGLPMEK